MGALFSGQDHLLGNLEKKCQGALRLTCPRYEVHISTALHSHFNLFTNTD